LRLSLIGLGVAALGIVGIYGPRKALRILVLPAGACLFTFGVFGLTGQTLNIFHLLGAVLGACLSFDYAVFAVESATNNQPPPVSIRLSALTTAASFGVLATSSIPVVAALGITVSIIVLTALLWVELTPRKT
jgi:predicted exporter